MADPVEVLLPIITRIEAKVDRLAESHGERIRIVEGKLTWKNLVVSAVVAVVVALVTGFTAGCHAPDAKFPSRAEMTRADKATVLITGLDANGGFTGTGFFTGPDRLWTAGHVCEVDALYTITTYDGHLAIAYPAFDNDIAPYDLCMMQVFGYEPEVTLEFERTPPEKWDPVYYVGYPQGMLTVQDGTFVGYHNGFARVAIPGYMGASGSALINERGKVVGVLSNLYPYDFNNIMFAPVDI